MTQPASPLIGPQFNNWTPIHQPSGSGWHAEVNNELREHLGRVLYFTAFAQKDFFIFEPFIDLYNMKIIFSEQICKCSFSRRQTN